MGQDHQLKFILTQNFICKIDAYSIIKANGIDCEKFLQGQLTCDMRDINEHRSSLGAYCNHKGRILALMRILKKADNYYLILSKALLNETLSLLKKYILFSKVQLTDVSLSYKHFGCSGSNMPTILTKLFDKIPLQVNEVTTHENISIIYIPGGQPRYELIGETDAMEKLWQTLAKETVIVDPSAWQLLNIRANIPSIYPTTMEQFTPHMINLPELGGVSFSKGCYVGQEIIARTQYLGKVKKHMVHASLESDEHPQAGDNLVDNNNAEIGKIIDSCESQPNHYELMVLLNENTADVIYWRDADGPKIRINNY